MTARQGHGFVFEDKIILDKTGLTKTELLKISGTTYTHKWDIPAGIYNGNQLIDHNIKTFKCERKTGTICCSDIMNFYNATTGSIPFKFVVGAYSTSNNGQKNVHTIFEFDINPQLHKNILWGSIDKLALEEFVEYVKSIPPGFDAQQKNKSWKARRDSVLGNSPGLIGINAKIDSKTARRTQGSLNLIKVLNSEIPHTKHVDSYGGLSLPFAI